jgi:hypothetical protein
MLNDEQLAFDLVNEFFKDENKTKMWFATKNPLLGGFKPNDMIKLGRTKKLVQFIETQLAENHI